MTSLLILKAFFCVYFPVATLITGMCTTGRLDTYVLSYVLTDETTVVGPWARIYVS